MREDANGRRVVGRRRALELAGLGTAVAVLGACDGTGDEPSPGGALTPAPGACHEGAATRPTDTGASDGGGASDVGIDPFLFSLRSLAVSPDGTMVAAAVSTGAKQLGKVDRAGTTVWSTADGHILDRFDNDLMGALTWHPDGSQLAVGGFQTIELTSPEGEVLWTLTGHRDIIVDSIEHHHDDLAYSSDGDLLASLGDDGMVRLWSGIGEAACSPGETLDTRALLPRSIALSPDGATLAVCGTRGAPQLWDVATATIVSEVEGVEFSPHVVAYGSDGSLYIGSGVPETYQVSDPERARLCIMGTDGQVVKGPDPHGIGVDDIAVHPEGARIAVLEKSDRYVMLWDRGTDTLTHLPETPTLTRPSRLAWSPDGARLYGVCSQDGVVCWDGTAWATFDLP